jgi:hypothetical protein
MNIGFGKLLFLTLIISFLFSCSDEKKNTQRSFCYWKTDLELNANDDSLLSELSVNHFYLHYFDIDWNPFEKKALPLGTVSRWWYWNIKNKFSITPSIFITNTVIENCSKQQLDELAENIQKRVKGIIEMHSENYGKEKGRYFSDMYYNNMSLSQDSLGRLADSTEKYSTKDFAEGIKEILIDCDWTKGTKEKYFSFLEKLRSIMPEYHFAATLRLWQYKNREDSGIPPVDRCLLMCYNLQNPTKYDSENSICSIGEMKKYVGPEKYPLKMDVALPVFSNGVIFRE